MSTTNLSHIPDGHIDIGGATLPRKELARVLPDIERFEASLTDALAVDSHLKNGDGSVPEYVKQWPEERLADVIITLKEIGSLREQLIRQTDDSDAPSN